MMKIPKKVLNFQRNSHNLSKYSFQNAEISTKNSGKYTEYGFKCTEYYNKGMNV